MNIDAFLGVLSGGLSGAIVVWLARNWLGERLRASIGHEYAQRLENHKADINARFAALSFDFQRDQLRAQLFFDHQRTAFSEILAGIIEVKKAWLKVYHPFEGEFEGVPWSAYEKFADIYYRHQLFLDSSCSAAVDLVLACLSDTFPQGEPGGPSYQRDVEIPLDRVEYLQTRVAELFRARIGVDSGAQAETEIVLLGAMMLVNQYHFPDIGLPPKDFLRIDDGERAADTVSRALRHSDLLVAKLRTFAAYLNDQQHGMFHEAMTSINRYVRILDPTDARSRVVRQTGA